jgi:CBS domain-containing protein
MQIKDILREKGSDVVTIDADSNIQDAVRMLNEHKIGSLIVTTRDGKIAGIITERDVLRKSGEHFAGKKKPETQEDTLPDSLVRDVMSKELVVGVPDDDLDYVMGIMTKNRIRHLPIVDDGKLVGMISIGDVVNAHLKETEFENHLLKDYIHRIVR